MARPSSTAQQRQLTLTEELEKLEQSITLTLQEIDHNFSRAHRIVTSSILPIVEQYATHSKDVWEGSKFWKQFFESSANVSLSNYEEQAYNQPQSNDDTVTEESQATSHTSLETSSYETPSAQHISTSSIQDLDLSNMTISPSKSSTPRPSTKQVKPTDQDATFADYPSPYDALRDEINQTAADPTALDQTQQTQLDLPSTPGRQQPTFPADIAMTPQSSPFLPPPPQSIRPSTTRKRTDPLLHRVLDRTYRIQATPLGKEKRLAPPTQTPPTAQRTRRLFDEPLSSSPVAPPQLHEELFSPQRKPRTPGVSVLTPARNRGNQAQKQKQNPLSTPGQGQRFETAPTTRNAYDSDDELDDSELQFGSPPKTMQFHVPQSRLLKTPAKEASQRIVDSILASAGLNMPGDEEYEEIDIDFNAPDAHDEYGNDYDSDLDAAAGQQVLQDDASPSVVRRANVEDETF